MDKLYIAIFFLFFAFSLASTPLTQQENDITNIKLPESDVTSTTNQFDKETQHVQENQDHLPEPRDKKTKALPLTFVRLRPINHHFQATSRRPSRLCDHHFYHAHNLKPRTESTHLDDQIPYGNDMIPSDDDNDDFDHVFPGGLHQVPEEWMNFLHQNNEDDNDDDDDEEQKMSKFIIKQKNHNKFGKMKLKGHLYDPFDELGDEDGKISAMQHEDHHSFDKKQMKKHLHHHHEEEEQEAVEGNEAHKEEKKTGGFVRHIRKFLDNYFD